MTTLTLSNEVIEIPLDNKGKAISIKYRLDIRNKFEKLDFKYYSSLRDAAIDESKYKDLGYRVKMQNYFNNQWI